MRKVYELRAELECVLERNGKTVLVQREECQSFTKWFKRLVGDFLTGNGQKGFSRLTIKDTSGADRTPSWYEVSGIIATFGDIVKNIGIGTSDTPFDPEQYELQSKLMDATGLTKSIDLQDYDAGVRFELTGTFNIQQSATVKETGLYGESLEGTNRSFTFLVSRDILSFPIDVVSGDVLFVRYRITIT